MRVKRETIGLDERYGIRGRGIVRSVVRGALVSAERAYTHECVGRGSYWARREVGDARAACVGTIHTS